MLLYPGDTRRKPARAEVQSGDPINRGLVLAALSGGAEVQNLAPGGAFLTSPLPVPLKATAIGRAADLRDDAGSVNNGLTATSTLSGAVLTCSFWINFGAISSWDRMFEARSATPTKDGLAIYRRKEDNYKVDCYIGGTRYQSNGVGITQGTWYHFVFEALNTSATAARVRVWENLTLRITQTKSSGGGFSLGWDSLHLGYVDAQPATYGRFSDWRIWNRALTPGERHRLHFERRAGLVQPIGIPAYVPAAGGAINPPIHLFTGMAA